MEEPLRTLVAGMIGGALMGMIFVTHLALLLVFNPPNILRERAVESTVSRLILIASLVMFLSWNMLAILMSFAAQATRSAQSIASAEISLAPSPIHLFIVLFVTAAMAIPGFILFRDKKRHLLGEIIVFVGIFGFLIPNLVVAIHRADI